MKNIMTIFKKEIKKVFSDKRMLISLFLPGVLIFIFYTLLGNVMTDSIMNSSTSNTTFNISYSTNYNTSTSSTPLLLESVNKLLKDNDQNNSSKYISFEYNSFEDQKELLKQNKTDLIILFSDNFENEILDLSKKESNSISLFYNGESGQSCDIYYIVIEAINDAYINYQQNIINGKYVDPNISVKDASMLRAISIIIPILTISLLYSTVVTLCPESIAGEKERGTLALLLLTPIKRSQFALGKVLSLLILSIASGTVTFAGIIFSLPSLMGNVNLGLGSIEYILLFLLIVSTLILFICIGIAFSSFAKSTKEAAGFLAPFTFVFMGLAFIPQLLDLSIGFSLFPVLNMSYAIKALLMQAPNMILIFTLTILSNLVFSIILIYIITKLFEKERIVLGQ